LGISVDESLSPSLAEKVSFLGVLLRSFPAGETAVQKLLEMTLGRKRIERLTERIGCERVAQRDGEVEAFGQLTLMEKLDGPSGVAIPHAACVMADGGRFQKTTSNADSKTHWHEYKAGFCGGLEGRADGVAAGEDAPDPLPEVPRFLLNLEQMETLTREVGRKAADVPERDELAVGVDEEAIDLDALSSLEQLEERVSQAQAPREEPSTKKLPWSPKVHSRDVVASSGTSDAFGAQLAARAWHLGLFQAEFKAFVGDGGSWLWTLWERHFKPFDFVPILDIIHAVTYLYGSAMAGQTQTQGGPVYRRWIGWVWQGEVGRVIVELAQRQQELGPPREDDGETSPRRIVNRALTYLQNQQSRMDYPRYRRLGLPITSSLMESTVKQLNQRIKGTEKFWTDRGGEAVLQLKADTLSDSDPLSRFWAYRQSEQNGLHRCCRRQTKTIASKI
jgi:hypothetical protein